MINVLVSVKDGKSIIRRMTQAIHSLPLKPETQNRIGAFTSGI